MRPVQREPVSGLPAIDSPLALSPLVCISHPVMPRHFSGRSAITMLAIFACLLSLGIQSLPAGSVLCMEHGGHIALECSSDICCLSLVDGDRTTDSGSSATGVKACKQCVDLCLPHDRFGLRHPPTVIVPVMFPESRVVAIIDWPVTRPLPRWTVDVAFVRPRHLAEIATIVIRC
jgi:hypothetical protein